MQVIVRQISGLGNQMFQYAAGRFYARHFRAPMRLAIDPARAAFSHGSPRPFLLSHYCISAPFAELTGWEHLLLATRPALKSAVDLAQRVSKSQVFRESLAQRYTFIDAPQVRPDLKTLYLAGYWQAYAVVQGVAADLRQEFRFRTPPQGKDLEVLNLMDSVGDSVSLHIRRGDYTLAAEGNIALPLDYYTRAIAFFTQRLRHPVFFVFSDDIAFARQNLPRDIHAVFVDHNDDHSSHQDIRLMSSCRNHILANSSFSWWGAWLNPRSDKLVYVPRYWHLTRQSYFPGLYGPDWIVGDFQPRS
jgi:hypothetical protein